MDIGALLATVIVLALVFLLLREVMCWYWKINENLKVMKQVLVELQVMNQKGID